MKRFWVGKTFPIAPITTQTTALANDQLPFPMLPALPPPPPLPPLPPLPPVTPSPRARDISSRRKIHEPGHGASIGNTLAAEHESFPATTTTTTTTITTTTTTAAAAVIAALASECCMQLSREGSGYGGCSGHLIPPPSGSQQSLPPPPPPPPLPPSLPPLHPRGTSRRRVEKPGCVRRHQALRVRWEKQAPLPAKEGDGRGSHAGDRAVSAVGAERDPA